MDNDDRHDATGDAADDRSDRLSALAAAISAGTYVVEPSAIARAIVGRLGARP